MKIPSIIEALLKAGFKVGMNTDAYKGPHFTLEGFYKHGELKLYPISDDIDEVQVEGRYGVLSDSVACLDELARINYEQWLTYRERFDGWKNPEPQWIPHLERLHLIEANIEISYTPV